tara:strand:- start:789 stop:989 length:201 start_codon:yes stop_codon:yes gene_type:complete
MWDINKKQLKYLSFYYFFLIFLVACAAFDFYMDTVTGFTFGYIGAFVYMWLRFQEAKELLKGDDDE